MKKIILLSMILSALSYGQALVFTNQTITVQPSQLSVESVEYRPLEVITNPVSSWVETEIVTTNGMFEGGTVETNTVSEQVFSEVITTNHAAWTCNVIFSLPSGHRWSLNGFPVSVERFKTRIAVPVDPAGVTATFGAAAAGLEFAASNGAYTPQGQVREAFLGLAAAALQAGIENGGDE